jgi:hypothetical protein
MFTKTPIVFKTGIIYLFGFQYFTVSKIIKTVKTIKLSDFAGTVKSIKLLALFCAKLVHNLYGFLNENDLKNLPYFCYNMRLRNLIRAKKSNRF